MRPGCFLCSERQRRGQEPFQATRRLGSSGDHPARGAQNLGSRPCSATSRSESNAVPRTVGCPLFQASGAREAGMSQSRCQIDLTIEMVEPNPRHPENSSHPCHKVPKIAFVKMCRWNESDAMCAGRS